MANIKIVELNPTDSELLSELTDKESTATLGGISLLPLLKTAANTAGAALSQGILDLFGFPG